MLNWGMKAICFLICVSTVCTVYPYEVQESPRTMESYSKPLPKYVKGDSHHKVATSEEDLYCLTEAIYYEAENQSLQGKEAVGIVIVNRVGNKRYPKTICEVTRQETMVTEEKKVCQFSFWCEEIKREPIAKHWKQSEQIAKRILKNYWDRDILSTMGDALYFHADYVNPAWKEEKTLLAKIGNHLFYSE